MLKDSPGDITSVILSGMPLLSMNSSKLSSRRRECGFTNDPIDSRFIDSSPADDCILDCCVVSVVCSLDEFSFDTNSLFGGFSFGINSLLSALNTRGDVFAVSLRSSCVSEPVTGDDMGGRDEVVAGDRSEPMTGDRSEPMTGATSLADDLTGDRDDATDDASPSLSHSDLGGNGMTSCMMPRKLVDRFCASWKK